MDNTSLISIIRTHRDNSMGAETGQLAIDRAAAMNHYHGRPYGNEVDGRSQVVSRDLAEAVDWALPGIMKVFTQSGRLAEFDPVGPEDEELAAQESDYVNQVLMRDNNGFMVLHDAIKDTLLLKNGYVKHWWEVEEKIEEASYSGLTMDAITLLMRDLEQEGAEVEVTGQESSFVDPMTLAGMPAMPQQNQAMGIMQPPMMTEVFELRLKIKRKCGKLMWMAVPSEEVRVSKKCRGSLQDSPFTEHVTKKTRSELIEMGMPYKFVYDLPAYSEVVNSTQSLARDSTLDESDRSSTDAGDRSMDEIQYCEAYVKVDYDGDGVAELRKVVTVADQIPDGEDWNEQIPAVPMTGFVAKRVPHRHVGESLDDELADLQEIMTVLKRQLLDNIYLNNNSEIVLNENANIRDFMTRTPGGLKRVAGKDPVQNAVMPLLTKPIIGDILPVIDYFDQSKETRTGISKATTGLDPDMLQNTTKGAFMENLAKASQKMEMIARLLAESGVKESVLQAHAILIRHQDRPRTVQLRGKWVPVNPQEWKMRTMLTVRVGLGTGSEEEKRGKLQLLSQLQGALLQAIGTAPPPVYQKMFAMFEDVAATLGIENPEQYAIAPMSPEHQQILQAAQQAQQAQQQGQPGADDLSKAAQIQAQSQMQIAGVKNEANLRIKAAEDQFNREKEMLKAQMDAQNKDADRRLQQFLEQMRLSHDAMNAEQDRRSREAIAAMQQEVILLTKGVGRDLGAPGISAGVQGAPGSPLEQQQEPAAEQSQDGPTGEMQPDPGL
jgi:hypothetical protein